MRGVVQSMARTRKQVQEFVLDEFLTTHQPVTILKMVDKTGLSNTYLRQVTRSDRNLVRTVGEYRIYSVDEPTRIHQTRKVEAYLPRREWLAGLYADARRKAYFWSTERMKR